MVEGSEGVRGFTVLLEEVRHEFRVLAEHEASLNQKLDRLSQEGGDRMAGLERKLDRVASTLNRKIDDIGHGVLELSGKVERLAQRFESHEHTRFGS